MSVRAVIFDFGNVLCPLPALAAYEPLRQLTGIPEPAFQRYFWRDRLDYDRNTLDGPAYWRSFAEMAGVTFDDGQIQRLIAQDIAMWQDLDPTLMEWVGQLKKKRFKTAVLSNMPADLAGYLRNRAGWLRQFDEAVFSGELGIVKPDEPIYRASLEGLGVEPAEALFIDDNQANVEGAQKLGMQALRFVAVPQLANDIQSLGLPRLPA